MFNGKKANMGGILLITVILFNIIMYIVIWGANADPNFASVGSGSTDYSAVNGSTNDDISITQATHWYDGFKVSVFIADLWWINIFYVTFQALLIGVALYMLIRGI